jgi:uncharacterized protein
MSPRSLSPRFAAVPLCALVLVAPSAALAADSPHGRPGDIPGKTEIHLSQQAVRVMARDRLSAALRIEAKGNNGREIQAEINRRMGAALAKVKAYPAVTAETGSYSVDRNWSTKEPDRWQGSQSLNLSSEDFDAVLSLVGELQATGLLVSEMQFFLAPETLTAVQDELTATALTAMRARADAVAKDLGMVVDRYRQIGVGNAHEDERRGATRSAGAAATRLGKAPSVQAGDATVMLSVSADIVLAPPKSR